MVPQRLIAALAAVALALPAAAQVESEGVPASLLGGLSPADVPLEFVQPPDVAAYRAEDEARNHWPLRYGALLEVDLGPFTHGVWDELEDGTLVWRLELYSPGAKSIGLELDEFWLSPGSEVYLYDAAYQRIAGAFTDVNNQPNEQIQLAPFRGDRVILEYVQPADAVSSRLSIGTVIYDYRDVFRLERELDAFDGAGDTAEGSCFVDVNCPQADEYPLSKRAVVRTLFGGGLCSGALVSNTALDGTQYVLTAWHCGQGTNTVFRFNYQTSGCGTGTAPTNQQVSGCTVLASNQASDGRLLRINTPIPTGYDPYYAPWTRLTGDPTEVYGMHHPGGTPKKFSFDGDGAIKQNVNILGIGNIPAWRADFDFGGVAGGSSGSPLFDRQDRVRGFLSGGPDGSCPTTSFYGRLDRFWNNTSIAQWLDPLGTGDLSCPGFDPGNPGGGPTNPQISSLSPATLDTVSPVAPVTVLIEGTGFTGTDDVLVDNQPVTFAVLSNDQIRIDLIGPFPVGSLLVEVVEGVDRDSAVLPVVAPTAPVVDLVNSDPGFLFQALPQTVHMGGQPGDLHFLLASTSDVPSVLPGLIDVGLGNNFTILVQIGAFAIPAAPGFTSVSLPISGLPSGTKLYFQSAVLPAANPILPLVPSNLESGTILF